MVFRGNGGGSQSSLTENKGGLWITDCQLTIDEKRKGRL